MIALIGKNTYGNDWNHIDRQAGLNCWIGKLADGTVTTIQTMPWDFKPWGCGSGVNGSCNNGWVQFEICEDGLTDPVYFEKVYKEACEITAYICQMFGIDPNGTVTMNGVKVPTILCHADSYKLGLGSNHGDVNHWFPKHGKSMATARADVAALLKAVEDKPSAPVETPSETNVEKTIWDFFTGKGLNAFAVGGIMGNLFAESALRPENLQNTYEKKLGVTDLEYTKAVDNGSYTNFVRDSAGYGLAQWTYWSRKTKIEQCYYSTQWRKKQMEIKINRLTLENFKCHRMLNLQLDGRSVSIYGDNATGKTSIYDALTWLLFGKDSAGNGEKNIDIKPLDPSGEVRDHQAITSVEAELQADGETVTLRRTYREVWATRRGTGDPVYEGNTSDYFVDGVPQKKNAFDLRVRELVPEDLFRMLTSVSYFAAGMKWQDRRAVLFDMAGTLTDKEIMAGAPQFAPLLDSMGRLSLSDYKAKLLSQKKGLTGVRDDAPTRINECQRVLDDLQGIDFEDARKEEKYLSAEKEDLSRRLISLEQDAELEKKRLELREVKLERDTLENRNKAYRDSQKAAGPDLAGIRKAIAEEQRGLNCDKTFLETTNRSVQRCEAEIQDSRDTYVRINGEAFSGGICPTCGQALPFEQLQEATRKFNKKKEAKLSEIISRANRLKEEMENYQAHVAEVETSMGQRKARIQELEEQLRSGQESTVKITDLPEYAETMAQNGHKGIS